MGSSDLEQVAEPGVEGIAGHLVSRTLLVRSASAHRSVAFGSRTSQLDPGDRWAAQHTFSQWPTSVPSSASQRITLPVFGRPGFQSRAPDQTETAPAHRPVPSLAL